MLCWSKEISVGNIKIPFTKSLWRKTKPLSRRRFYPEFQQKELAWARLLTLVETIRYISVVIRADFLQYTDILQSLKRSVIHHTLVYFSLTSPEYLLCGWNMVFSKNKDEGTQQNATIHLTKLNFTLEYVYNICSNQEKKKWWVHSHSDFFSKVSIRRTLLSCHTEVL